MVKKSGIYQIRNIINNKVYIGSAVNLKYRKNVHFHLLNKNKHHSRYLQRAFNKYGKENLEFEILEHCEKEKLIEREQYYLDNFNPSYNIRKIADSNLGIKMSDEFRNKVRLRMLSDKNHRKGTLSSLKGKKWSEESKLKLKGRVSWNKGKKMSEEAKQKMSKAKQGSNHWIYGKPSHKRKQVHQIDRNTNKIINTFDSLKIASSTIKIAPQNITAACRGRCNTAGGFRWSYNNK